MSYKPIPILVNGIATHTSLIANIFRGTVGVVSPGATGNVGIGGSISVNGGGSLSGNGNGGAGGIISLIGGGGVSTGGMTGGAGGNITMTGASSGNGYNGGAAGNISTSGSVVHTGGNINTAATTLASGGHVNTSSGGNIHTFLGGGSITTNTYGGSINTASGGGSINTLTGVIELGESGSRLTVQADFTASIPWTLTLPQNGGVNGQILTTNGAGVTSWTTLAAATPAGSGSELQYRIDGSTFGAVTGSSVSGSNLTLAGSITANAFIGDGSALTNLNASNISSGALALAWIAQGGATPGQALTWNGSAWAPATGAGGITINSTTANGTAGRVLYTDGSKVQAYTITGTAGTGGVVMAYSPALEGAPTSVTPFDNSVPTKIATTGYVETRVNSKANLASPSFSGQVGIPAGTVSAPSIYVTSVGANHGIYFAGNSVDFSINGTRRGWVDANGLNGSGAQITNLNASNLSSGTVPTARISGLPPSAVTGTAAILGANTFTGLQTFTDRITVIKAGFAETGGIVVDTDPSNTAVRATFILPPANSGRVYIGRSGQAAYALSLTNCSNIENSPPVSYVNGITIGATNTNTFVARGAGGTDIGANHPNGYGLEIYQDTSYATAVISHRTASFHRTDGISLYGLSTSRTIYETLNMRYNTALSVYEIRPVAAGAGTVRPVRYHTTTTVHWSSGAGTPETFVAAGVGSLYTDTNNGNLWRKTSGGATATGWVTP